MQELEAEKGIMGNGNIGMMGGIKQVQDIFSTPNNPTSSIPTPKGSLSPEPSSLNNRRNK